MSFKQIKSQEDSSVNFVKDTVDGGKIEARFVQRDPGYFIVYLSSFSGCNLSCRFCHLTASRQVQDTAVTREGFIEQSKIVLDYASSQESTMDSKVVHFNFMARGEPLKNPYIVEHGSDLFDELEGLASSYGLKAKFNVSSIIPVDFQGDLIKIFAHPQSELFYSLYSINPSFRKKWIPKGMAPEKALGLINQMQKTLGKRVTFHWALIEGENDSVDELYDLRNLLDMFHIFAKFNLVRYNPYNEDKGKESQETTLEAYLVAFTSIRRILRNESRIVPRVGFDVKASCGMFL